MKVTITVEILDDMNTLADYEKYVHQTKETLADRYEKIFNYVANTVAQGIAMSSKVNVEITDTCEW